MASEARLLNAAVDAMPCGFSLWSDKFELVLFNQRYLELYGFSKDRIVRGMSLFEVNLISVELGNHPQSDAKTVNKRYEGAFIRQREAGEPLMFDRVLANRSVRVHTAYRDGLGWLVTHEDISEEKARQQAQKVRERELHLQSMRFKAAVTNLKQGLAMFDSRRRLIRSEEHTSELQSH